MIAKSSQGAIALSLIASLNLYAAEDSSTRLNATVITTTGFESALKDEVRNVTVITAKEIEDRGYRDIKEALEKAPGVSLNGNNVDMRGQGSRRSSSARSTTTVKVMVDGVALNMIDTTPTRIPVDMIPIEDVDRIEIVPGGGTVLYGSGTMGGVINIITKKSKKKFYAGVSSKLASYSYKDVALNVGGGVTDALSLKLNAKKSDSNGYRRGEKTKEDYVSGGLTYQITDDQALSIDSSYFKDKSRTTGALSKAQLEQDRRQAGSSKTDFLNKRVSVNADYSINLNDALTFNLSPYYQKLTMDSYSAYKDGGSGALGLTDKQAGAKFKGKYGYGSGDFIFGYDFLRQEAKRSIRSKSTGRRGPITVSADVTTKFDVEKKTHSFYVLEKHDFTDQFSLSAGYRFELARNDMDRRSNSVVKMTPGRTIASDSSFKGKKNSDDHAFEITPSFKYSDTGNVYFKFERGFVSPSPVQFVDKPNRTDYVVNNLKSETYQTYELGVRDMIYDNFISATVFLTDTKNEIYTRTLTNNITDGWFFINLDDVRRYGAELYAEQQILDNLKTSQTFSYVKAEFKKGNNKGMEVPTVQKSKFVASLDYEPIKDLNLLLDVKYLSKLKRAIYSGVTDISGYETQTVSRTLVDLGAKYKFKGGFSVSAGVKNLFNKKYNAYQSELEDIYEPADERNYYVEFKYAY
nr:TonB-dependent receptor [uncultured Campylobacter sp.]